MKLEEKTEMIPQTPLYKRALAAMEQAGADTSLLGLISVALSDKGDI